MNDNTELSHLPISFRYVKDDFLAATKLSTRLTRKWWLTRGAFVLIMGFILMYLARDDAASTFYYITLIFGVAAFLIIFNLFIAPHRAGKQFDQQPLAQHEATIAVREDGITIEAPRGSSRLLWQDFHGWRANKDTLLIYGSPCWYWIIPKRTEALGFPFEALTQKLQAELGPQKS